MGVSSQSRLWELESKESTLGVAKSLIFILAGLPKNTRVAGFLLMADFNVTTAGADGARPENIVSKLYASLEHQSDFFQLRSTGCLLNRLYHHMHGRQLNNALFGAAIQVGRAPVWIPLMDPNAVEPLDTAIPSELLEGKTLEVKTSAVTAVQLFGAAAVATVTHRLFAVLADGVGAIDPSATRIDYEDWGGQTVRLKQGGVYSHLLIYNEPDAFADPETIQPDSDVTRVNFTYEGEQVVKSALTTALVLEYNRQQVSGGFEDNNAEQISDIDVPFLPIFSPGRNYKIPALPGGAGQAILELSGDQTAFRIGYRQVTVKNINQMQVVQQKMLPNAATVTRTLRTADKSMPGGTSIQADDVNRRSRISQLIPGRLNVLS